jgi:electron transfer flavoprotein beta subunit
MNIVVCVKYVPDAQAERTFDASDNTTDRANVDGLLSELDEYAVEEALKIVEAGEGQVTVVTVGPDQASDAIKKALQMGADKGVHVIDDAIHGSDALATSLLLAKAIEKVGGADLVLTGMSLHRRHHGRRADDARRAAGPARRSPTPRS